MLETQHVQIIFKVWDPDLNLGRSLGTFGTLWMSLWAPRGAMSKAYPNKASGIIFQGTKISRNVDTVINVHMWQNQKSHSQTALSLRPALALEGEGGNISKTPCGMSPPHPQTPRAQHDPGEGSYPRLFCREFAEPAACEGGLAKGSKARTST